MLRADSSSDGRDKLRVEPAPDERFMGICDTQGVQGHVVREELDGESQKSVPPGIGCQQGRQ
jgi:hypothetical protein